MPAVLTVPAQHAPLSQHASGRLAGLHTLLLPTDESVRRRRLYNNHLACDSAGRSSIGHEQCRLAAPCHI